MARNHAWRIGLVGLVVGGAAAACTDPPATPAPSVTERVSVATAGTQGNASTLFTPAPQASDDGRYVVFQSDASNLVPGDANGQTDVFVRDRSTGTTTLVSVAIGGGSGNGPSRSPSISGNGRYVAFDSAAPDLVSGDSNGTYDAFVRDLQTGTTELVSLDSTGARTSSASYVNWGTDISDDGSKVLFETYGAMVPGDTNADRDVYVRDRVAGTTTRASEGSGGTQIAGYSQEGVISGDGRFVAFDTNTDGAVPGDANGQSDVLVKDLQTGTLDIASVNSAEQSSTTGSSWASISDDGRFVAFSAFDSNLVPGDTDVGYDVILRDRVAGTTSIASLDAAGLNSNGYAYTTGSGVSDDGSRIAFYSYGGTTTDGNGYDADVFVRDTTAGTTTRLSIGPADVQGNGASFSPSISGNGRVVPFWSDATNLVAGDTNGFRDVFARVLGS